MLTYNDVGDVYPPRGDQRWAVIGALFLRAASGQVHVALIDDSQGTIGGSYGGGPCALMMMLNQASGTKIPGTPWMPARARGSTGGYFPASHTARSPSNVGTIDQSKFPPGFAGPISPAAPYPGDFGSADAGLGVCMMPDSLRVEHNIDMICQGQTSLLTKDDTNWYMDVLAVGCNDANVHGGTAGDEITVNAWKGSQPAIYFGGGSPAGTLTFSNTSTALDLTTVGVDDPAAVHTVGPFPFGAENYIGARATGGQAGKVRIGAFRVYHRTEPGWFVHVFSEGGYRIIASSSWYTDHANSGPFFRKLFSVARDEKPDLSIFGLGTNDIFGASPRSAEDYKAEIRLFFDWYWGESGGWHPTIIKGEPWRGDSATSNYATYIVEYGKMAGAIKELIDEGYPILFYNGLLSSVRYSGSLTAAYLSETIFLDDFSTLVNAAGPVTITQNVHYVSHLRRGHFQHFLWTGATTTIGTAGVISSTRHGPGGDLTIGAPVSAAPVDSWQPIFPEAGRQGNVGAGAPNDFVHLCSSGQQEEWARFTRSALGAAAAVRPAPNRIYRR